MSASGTNAGGRVRPARPEDVPRIHALMHGLAVYERLEHAFLVTPGDVQEALFGRSPSAECLVLEQDGALAGYALHYPVFSSFRGRRTMWLEDLFVDPATRASGGGRRLMAALARRCVERGITRIGWIVLDWNEPALGFYRHLGGAEQATSDWRTYALDEDGVRALAAEAGD